MDEEDGLGGKIWVTRNLTVVEVNRRMGHFPPSLTLPQESHMHTSLFPLVVTVGG